jgi:hypothetical protein
LELSFMKARIAFYFAAVVALVLFLAATVPSHATQHRDPAQTPENMQKSASAANPTPANSAAGSDSSGQKSHSPAAKSRKQTSGTQHSKAKSGR